MKRFAFAIAVLSAALSSVLFCPSSTLAREDYFTVDVYFQSEDEDVNAFGTQLVLPTAWTVEDLTLKDSDLIYWVEAPEKPTRAFMNFSGIFPGGVRNLSHYRSPLLLFSINVSGDIDLASGLYFQDSELYLNHPMALAGVSSGFATQVRASTEMVSSDLAALNDLDYEFTTDPVSGGHSLVLNSTRGALASYTFEVQEGDFGMGIWERMNGVASLNAKTSTVSLFVSAPDGFQDTMVLRSSLLRSAGILLGIILGCSLWSTSSSSLCECCALIL